MEWTYSRCSPPNEIEYAGPDVVVFHQVGLIKVYMCYNSVQMFSYLAWTPGENGNFTNREITLVA